VNLSTITPLILTFNEAANIERTLRGLSWARSIVIVDSGSTDTTLDILAKIPSATILSRQFDDFASQCNFGLQHVQTPWTFSIDADYVCPPDFEKELASRRADAAGYESYFTYCIGGRALRSCLYPPRVTLFRTELGHYYSDGHAHRLHLQGEIVLLKTLILHDDRKSLDRWLREQCRYAELEVGKLRSIQPANISWKDRLRKTIIWAPPLTLFYCLFYKRLILDGWPGIYYSLQRTYAELLLSLKLLEARLGGSRRESSGADKACD